MRIKPTKYLIFGIARSDRCKPITTTPMIGQVAGCLSLCPAKPEFPLQAKTLKPISTPGKSFFACNHPYPNAPQA